MIDINVVCDKLHCTNNIERNFVRTHIVPSLVWCEKRKKQRDSLLVSTRKHTLQDVFCDTITHEKDKLATK